MLDGGEFCAAGVLGVGAARMLAFGTFVALELGKVVADLRAALGSALSGLHELEQIDLRGVQLLLQGLRIAADSVEDFLQGRRVLLAA
jgi:hypothetical protein